MSKQYTNEFRDEAAGLVLEGKSSLAQVARDLGVSGWTLRGWVKKHSQSNLHDWQSFILNDSVVFI